MRLLQIIKYAFKYRRRIKAHIKRVQYFYTKIVYADMIPMMKDIDIDRVMNHDKDKLKLKNLVRQVFRYIPGPLSDKEKLAIHNVVMEHIKSNKHHCEYWSDGDYASEGNDCTKMAGYQYEALRMDASLFVAGMIGNVVLMLGFIIYYSVRISQVK